MGALDALQAAGWEKMASGTALAQLAASLAWHYLVWCMLSNLLHNGGLPIYGISWCIAGIVLEERERQKKQLVNFCCKNPSLQPRKKDPTQEMKRRGCGHITALWYNTHIHKHTRWSLSGDSGLYGIILCRRGSVTGNKSFHLNKWWWILVLPDGSGVNICHY